LGYLQFAPVIGFSFVWHIEYVLLCSNIAVSSEEGILVDGIPVDKKVDDWAVISGDKGRQLVEAADGHAVV